MKPSSADIRHAERLIIPVPSDPSVTVRRIYLRYSFPVHHCFPSTYSLFMLKRTYLYPKEEYCYALNTYAPEKTSFDMRHH